MSSSSMRERALTRLSSFSSSSYFSGCCEATPFFILVDKVLNYADMVLVPIHTRLRRILGRSSVARKKRGVAETHKPTLTLISELIRTGKKYLYLKLDSL